VAVPLSTDDLALFFDERHHALAGELREAAGALADHSKDARALSDAMAQCGLYRLLVPEQSIDVRALCLARELLGYVSPLADAIFAVQGLGAHPIALAGSPAQRGLLASAADGSAVFGFALTEPGAGSDVAALATTARRDGDRFRLDGEKTLISNVGIATHFVAFANVDPALGRKGISAFLVEAGAPGLAAEPIAMSVEHPIGRLRFDGCEASLVGEAGEGFALAMRTLDTFRVTVGAAACGMARRALDETIDHVRARRQFGRPLAEQQTVQGYVAEMATELDAARLLVLRAAHARDAGRGRTVDTAMAKLAATESAQRIVDRAVQLHGGLGVTLGTPVERLYREIRPLRIYEGTTEIQKLILGSSLVKQTREGEA